MDYNRLNGPQRKVMRTVLAGVFPDRRELDLFLEDSGRDSLNMVAGDGNYAYQLFELIKRYAARGTLGALVADLHAQFPESPAIVDLDARLGLLSEDDPAIRRLAGSTGGLERLVRDTGEADLYLWTDKLLGLGRRICRIRYLATGGIVYGTGFLVGPDLVLTNFHVVEPLLLGQANPDTCRVRFDYAERADQRQEGMDYALADDWQVRHAPYSPADLAVDAGLPSAGELDFAVIRLAEAVGGEAAAGGTARGWIDLAEAGNAAAEGAIVFIIQHPDGQPIKQTIGLLQASPTPLRLRYDADTGKGSSGALVLDANLNPIALHHAGDPDSKIKARYNQGIPLGLIRTALDGGEPR